MGGGPFGGFKQRRFVLEVVSADSLNQSKKHWEKFLDFHWDYYWELEKQRARVYPQLLDTLSRASTRQFQIKQWHRAFKLKYALDPLNPIGSTISLGGRFNIGTIEEYSRCPPFPAIYLASTTKTAIDECLGVRSARGEKLSAYDVSLTKQDSIGVVTVNGELGPVLNLGNPHVFDEFIHIIKKFTLSKELKRRAKRLKMDKFDLVRTRELLFSTLLADNWRLFPAQFDVPASCQIFGRLVKDAGIEGILYPSTWTGDECCALFPTNFKNSDSFVEVRMEELPPGATRSRIDSSFVPS